MVKMVKKTKENKATEAPRKVKPGAGLKPEGELIVTIPCNYNPFLDTLMLEGAFPELYCMKRIDLMEWEQCSVGEAYKYKMNDPYPNANAIVIGTTKCGLCERSKEEKDGN